MAGDEPLQSGFMVHNCPAEPAFPTAFVSTLMHLTASTYLVQNKVLPSVPSVPTLSSPWEPSTFVIHLACLINYGL